jgi:hypothetical protein
MGRVRRDPEWAKKEEETMGQASPSKDKVTGDDGGDGSNTGQTA